MPIRVLIVDDHTIVRQGLRALLSDAEGIDIVGDAGDGHEAVAACQGLSVDVILMDVLMPSMDGATATKTILEQWPDIKIVALSGADIDERIFAAIRAGALGYVSKSSSKIELVQAISQVAVGRASMPAEMTKRLVARLGSQGEVRAQLSDRELAIMRLMAKGLGNREIGSHLSISEATVRAHLYNIFGKLKVRNRVEATLYALHAGVTTLEESLAPAG